MHMITKLGLAALSMAAFTAPAYAVNSVVDGKCVSVADAHGCLFDGNIQGTTSAQTQTAYNTYNDTHPSANPDITLNYLFKSDDGAGFPGTITANTAFTSGTYSTPGYLIDFIAVKAADQFVLYKLATPASSGSWNTFDIPYLNKKGQGNPHALSHLAFFGIADVGPGVPEPAAWAMLIARFGLVGGALRRRNSGLASVTA